MFIYGSDVNPNSSIYEASDFDLEAVSECSLNLLIN